MSGACMPARRVVHLLLLTANPDLAELYRQDCPECVVTIAVDAASAVRKAPKHRFDTVIIESRKDWVHEMKVLIEVVEAGATFVYVWGAARRLLSTCQCRDVCTVHRTSRCVT